MKYIYDNGTILLGTVKNIKEYIKKYMETLDTIEDRIELDMFEKILSDLEDEKNDTIVAIDYENNSYMGCSMKFWKKGTRL